MKQYTQFDMIIVGGGLAGCCLAYALKDLPLNIALIEARPFDKSLHNSDLRGIALTYGSYYFLKNIGLWGNLSEAATPIEQVHVSDKGHFGITHFNAKSLSLPALGYVIPFDTLQPHFQQAVKNLSTVKVFSPAEVFSLEKEKEIWHVHISSSNQAQILSTPLLIGADGANSSIRRLQNIPVKEWDYDQTAILAHLNLKRDLHNIAYERFTENGAIALLPFQKKQAALIWTVKNSNLNELLTLNDTQFLKHLQKTFGYRAGYFESISKRQTYPLKMRYAAPNPKDEIILLGNAAHTLHPIAAQGFNLGLRDVATLNQLLRLKTKEKTIYEHFLKERNTDHQQTLYFTDSLTHIFTNNCLPLTFVRNLGLSLLEQMPFLKNKFASQLLGMVR
ncbi:MAG: 2-octaprenyl-6-methoxyphenol hydroxylase [Legionellaceae bacterium]